MKTIHSLFLKQLNILLLATALFGYSCNTAKDENNTADTESTKPLSKDDAEPDNTIFGGWEEQPEPTAGMGAFYEYVDATLTYPEEAKADSIEGKVFVQFVVTEDGKITEVETIKGIGYGCDEEAERIMREANDWKPGKQRGNPVEVGMVLPITFRLDSLDVGN